MSEQVTSTHAQGTAAAAISSSSRPDLLWGIHVHGCSICLQLSDYLLGAKLQQAAHRCERMKTDSCWWCSVVLSYRVHTSASTARVSLTILAASGELKYISAWLRQMTQLSGLEKCSAEACKREWGLTRHRVCQWTHL